MHNALRLHNTLSKCMTKTDKKNNNNTKKYDLILKASKCFAARLGQQICISVSIRWHSKKKKKAVTSWMDYIIYRLCHPSPDFQLGLLERINSIELKGNSNCFLFIEMLILQLLEFFFFLNRLLLFNYTSQFGLL